MRQLPWLAIGLWAAVGLTVIGVGVGDIGRARRGDTGDFAHFYWAADAVRHGRNPYAAHTRGYIYPPPPAFALQPLSLLPIDRAALLMLAVNVTVTVATLALLAAEFLRRFDAPRRDAAAVAAVVLIGLLLDVDKVKGQWQMWQTDVWVLLLFALALRWLDRRPAWAGVALGVGANLKYLHLLAVPYLLARRRWAAATSAVVSAVAVAVLPAAQVGWAATGRLWATAWAGITGMGTATAANGGRAEVHAITDSLSCSVTSAICRAAVRHGGSAEVGLVIAAAVGLALLAVVVGLYRSRRVPVIGVVTARQVGVEWPVVVAVLLAFSPQTNTRHLYDALLLTTVAAVLLLVPGGRPRWPLAVGCVVLAAGFALPPGRRSVVGAWSPTVAWLRAGGPCWCLLVGAGTVLWTGIGTTATECEKADVRRSTGMAASAAINGG